MSFIPKFPLKGFRPYKNKYFSINKRFLEIYFLFFYVTHSFFAFLSLRKPEIPLYCEISGYQPKIKKTERAAIVHSPNNTLKAKGYIIF